VIENVLLAVHAVSTKSDGRWNASGNGAGTIMHDPNATTQNKKDDEVNFGGSARKANFLGGRSLG